MLQRTIEHLWPDFKSHIPACALWIVYVDPMIGTAELHQSSWVNVSQLFTSG